MERSEIRDEEFVDNGSYLLTTNGEQEDRHLAYQLMFFRWKGKNGV